MFDLNSDRAIDKEDLRVWVEDLKGTHFGDANLDGEFNSTDLVNVLQAGQCEDALEDNSGWASGDWNADGDFTNSDLVLALQAGGYDQGPRVTVATLPVNMLVPATTQGLHAGDADQDLDFDQLDLVQVQVAAKYLTGQAATWGQGDWDGAPGGLPGNPPAGNGLFDQLDVVAALAAGTYLTGPYAAVQPNGQVSDGQTSVIYNAGTGEVSVDAPAGLELTSINFDSAAGIFTGEAAANLGGSFDTDADANIFKATFGSSFGSLSFGNVAQTGLSEESVLGDLTVIGSLAGGGDLGNVDLVYVPEPASALLLAIGLVIGLTRI
jgi:hypothetical protein